jgi:hypothetical protein
MSSGVRFSPVIPPMVPRIPEIDLIKGTFKGFYQKMPFARRRGVKIRKNNET